MMPKSRRTKRKNTGSESRRRAKEIPLYTGSLDAAVPGERIVAVCFDPHSNKWIAVHADDADRYVLGIGQTEPLARRIAGLKALEVKESWSTSTERQASKEAALSTLLEALNRLANAIEKNNEYSAINPVDQEARLIEIRSAASILERAKKIATPTFVALTVTLTYLSAKFADAVIGRLADAAAAQLEKYLGL